jgi:hypothetical protein
MSDQVKEDKRGGGKARVGKMKNAREILVGKPEGKRPLGRLRYRLDDNIKVHLKEIGCKDVNWIHLAHYND